MPEAPELPDDWTEPERWAWEQIAAGKVADFNARAKEADGAAVPLDPATAVGWGADQRLRAGFLQCILTGQRFVEATPFGGVRIRGALVDDAPLDLEHARLPHHFWLGKSQIETAVKARNLRVDGVLSLEASHIAGHIDLNGARIEELLSIEGASLEATVDLTGARIGGNLQLGGASFAGSISLNRATIKGSAFLERFHADRNLFPILICARM